MMIFTRMKHMLKFVRKPYNGDGIRVLHGIFYRYIQMYMLVFSLSTQQHTIRLPCNYSSLFPTEWLSLFGRKSCLPYLKLVNLRGPTFTPNDIHIWFHSFLWTSDVIVWVTIKTKYEQIPTVFAIRVMVNLISINLYPNSWVYYDFQ